jgi:hypothetical protein
MNIQISEIRNNMFLLRFKNQYDVTSTFMRLQEFYESPYKGIRNCYFTLEQYMDRYALETGNFTYYSDWSGFNVPGNVVKDFFNKFEDNLLDKEKELYNIIRDIVNLDRFYLIAVYDEDDLDHEISHGYYYLDDQYKNEMDSITKYLKYKIRLENKLIKLGYTKSVLSDEIQAYLSTTDTFELKDVFKLKIDDNIKKYREIFRKRNNKK